MAKFQTLKALQKKQEESNSSGGNAYVTLKDGESVKLYFRQELSEDGKNFNKDAGCAEVVAIHRHPTLFKNSMRCTADSEAFGFKCWACEQVGTGGKESYKWKAKNRLYVNVGVLTNEDDNTWENKILDTSFFEKHIGGIMVEYALEQGTLLSHVYRMKRKGSEFNNTSYTLIPVEMVSEAPKELKDLPLVPLADVGPREIAYEDQEEHMTRSDDKEPASSGAKGWG